MITGSFKNAIIILFVVSIGTIFVSVQGESITNTSSQKTTLNDKSTYNPKIMPSDFTSKINNKFFSLVPGKTLVYEAQVKEGIERNEVVVTNEKRTVMGVQTTVVWDRVWLNGELIEDTKDWYAQDKKGNVWYFGEDSKEFEGGKLVGTEGSWEAGKNGAKPGIIMKASPKVGDTYRQEYYVGHAEDMAKVVGLRETVTVPYGKFSNCLKTRDWTPLEPNATEFKYYCSQISGVVLEEIPADGEKMELIKVMSGKYSRQETITKPIAKAEPTTPVKPAPATPTKTVSEITKEQAIEIAKSAMAGTVTDISTEYKFGKFAWVIEMQTASRGEVDVVVDKITGQVLGIE